MKIRWYIYAFIVSFALLGGVYQHQTAVPNQEIVLKFNDITVSSDDIQQAISTVKQQLNSVGVQNINVKTLQDGRLKISYYSVSKINTVKKALLKDGLLTFDFGLNAKNKSDKKQSNTSSALSYNVDVYEIQNSPDASKELNGIQHVETEVTHDHFFEPNLFVFFQHTDFKAENNQIKIALKIRRHITLRVDDTSITIPEVRAGPIC